MIGISFCLAVQFSTYILWFKHITYRFSSWICSVVRNILNKDQYIVTYRTRQRTDRHKRT